MAQSIPFARSSVYTPSLTVADLLLRSGQDRAQAEQRRGDISAAMWSGVANNLAAIPSQIMSAKRMETRDKMDRQEMTARAAAMQDEQDARTRGKADAATLAGALPKGRVAALQSLEANPALYAKAKGHFDAIDDNYKRLMGSVAAGVREFGDTPDAAITALDDLVEQGFDPAKLVPLRKQIIERPEGIKALVDNLLKQSPDEAHRALVSKAPPTPKFGERDPTKDIIDELTGKVITPGTPKAEKPERAPQPTEASLAVMAANGDKNAQAALAIIRAQHPREPRVEGLRQVMGPNGTPIWVKDSDAVGKPAAQAPRAVTGQERQSLAFYNRAKEAVETLTTGGAESLEQKIAGQSLTNQVRGKFAWNVMQTEDQQRYRQAQRAFTEARLRKESGAAIPESEFENDAKTYFQQPGDNPATVAQKEKSRNTVLEGLKFGAGKAYDEFYGESSKSPVEEWVRDKDGKLVRKP